MVAMPNPFYQIYEGAALLAGAEPVYLDTTAAEPLPAGSRCGAGRDMAALPGAVPVQPRQSGRRGDGARLSAPRAGARRTATTSSSPRTSVMRSSSRRERAAASLLQAALRQGPRSFQRCMVFHSLSKRSSVPGLRSASSRAMPPSSSPSFSTAPTTAARCRCRRSSQHRRLERRRARAANRALYREKYDRVLPILAPVLDMVEPDGGFYLWPDVPRDDEAFTRDLFATQNLTVLPGSYLARDTRAAAIPAGGASASRWSPPSTNA